MARERQLHGRGASAKDGVLIRPMEHHDAAQVLAIYQEAHTRQTTVRREQADPTQAG